MMTSYTLMWAAVLVTELTLFGNASGLSLKSKRTPSQSESVDSSLFRRPAWKEKGLKHIFGVDLTHREKRQYFQRPDSDHSLLSLNHLSDHGTFNQDTSLCDDILWRSCRSPSDCEGCLGLFTCNLSRGTCYFKGISSNTGNFYQSLRGDQEQDGDSR